MNWNGVRQRISKFRGEQKKKFEELGWDAVGGAVGGGGGDTPAKSKAPATPRKRKGGADNDGGEGQETPSKAKKGRAEKVKSEEVGVKEEEEMVESV